MQIILETLSVLVVVISFAGAGQISLNGLKLCHLMFPFNLLFGAGLYSMTISTLGYFFSLQMITIVFLLIGAGGGATLLIRKYFSGFKIVSLHWSLWLYFVFSLVIAFYPSTYFDPLNYHLFGTIQWAKLDRLVHLTSATQVMHNSYADYLYLPFAIFMSNQSESSLMSAQVSAQILTVIMGIFSFTLLLTTFLKSRIQNLWIPLLIFSAITRASLQHKGLIAKNDWIAISWFCSAMILLQGRDLISMPQYLVASLLLGFSLGTKLTYASAAIVFLLVFFFTNHKTNKKKMIFTSSVVLLTITPYLLRNYMWTGNPIFPMGHGLFSSNFLGPSWLEGFELFNIGLQEFSTDMIINKTRRIFTYDLLPYFFVVIPIFFNDLRTEIKILWAGILFWIIIFFVGFGFYSELRHFGPIAIGLNLFGAYGVYLLSLKFKFKHGVNKLIIYSLIGLMVYNFSTLENQLNPIPSAIRGGEFTPRNSSLINERKGLVAATELKNIYKPAEKVALIDDTPPYYFTAYEILRLWDDAKLDKALKACENLLCVADILSKEKIVYLIDTEFTFDPYYNLGIVNGLRTARQNFPEIVFSSKNGEYIILVEKLTNALSDRNLKP